MFAVELMFIKFVGTRTRGARGDRGRTRTRGGRRGGRGGRGAYCTSCYLAVRAPDTKTSPSPRFDVPNFAHIVLCFIQPFSATIRLLVFFKQERFMSPSMSKCCAVFKPKKKRPPCVKPPDLYHSEHDRNHMSLCDCREAERDHDLKWHAPPFCPPFSVSTTLTYVIAAS